MKRNLCYAAAITRRMSADCWADKPGSTLWAFANSHIADFHSLALPNLVNFSTFIFTLFLFRGSFQTEAGQQEKKNPHAPPPLWGCRLPATCFSCRKRFIANQKPHGGAAKLWLRFSVFITLNPTLLDPTSERPTRCSSVNLHLHAGGFRSLFCSLSTCSTVGSFGGMFTG